MAGWQAKKPFDRISDGIEINTGLVIVNLHEQVHKFSELAFAINDEG